MSAVPSANAFLNWLLGAGDPPFPMRCAELEAAMSWLNRRLARLARRFVERNADLDTYVALMTTDRHRLMLKYWVEMVAPYHGQTTQRGLARLTLAMGDQYLRFWQRLSAPQAPFHVHLLRLRRRLARAKDTRWQTMINAGLDEPASRIKMALDKDMERLTLRLQRREDRFSLKLARQGGLLFKRWPGLADQPGIQEEARRAALRRQEHGFLVYATEDPGIHLMECSPRAAVRQQVWERQQHQVQVRVADIEKMRDLRQQSAEEAGHVDHASYQMSNTALLVPRRAERLLERSLDMVRAPLTQAIRRGAAQHGLDSSEAYNLRFAVVAGAGGRIQPSFPSQAFPWRATAVKVMVELMRLGGWVCQSAPKTLGRDTRRMLRFNFQHPDGRRAQVWYAPYNPSASPNSQTAAQACLVRHVTQEEGDVVRVCMLDHRLPDGRDHFLRDDLEHLCHEVGHILHFLALPGRAPYEDGLLTDDFAEVPSILLERYYRDPDTLIRWLSTKAPAYMRQRRYWTRHLRVYPIETQQYQRRLARAYLDLRLHRKDAGTFEQVTAAYQEHLSAPLHPQQRDHLNYFNWSGQSALGISHLAGEALAHQLSPLDSRGQVQSTQVGGVFVELLDVLARGVDAHKVSRAWRHWRGTTMIADLDEGFEAVARSYIRQVRRPRRSRANRG